MAALPRIAKGIVTRGRVIGKGYANSFVSSGMIIGYFSLGPIKISFGTGGGAGPAPAKDQKTFDIIVTYRGRTWKRSYDAKDKIGRLIIKVTKGINTVTSGISVKYHHIRQILKSITVRVWQRKD